MPLYNLIEYSYNYSKTSGSSLQSIMTNQFWKMLPLLIIFLVIVLRLNLSIQKKNWFNKGWWYKKCWNNGPIGIFKWFFLGTLEIPSINFEITLILTWSQNCVISNATVNQATTFVIANTKLYAQVVTLSTDDSGKFLQQLKSRFKRTIDWNKYQSKPTK